jgi:hypothetical protein
LTAVRHASAPGVSHDLHCAYFGEPTPCKVEGEAEKPNAPMSAQILGNCLHQSVHKEEACGPGGSGKCPACGGCVKVDAGLYRWRWL